MIRTTTATGEPKLATGTIAADSLVPSTAILLEKVAATQAKCATRGRCGSGAVHPLRLANMMLLGCR